LDAEQYPLADAPAALAMLPNKFVTGLDPGAGLGLDSTELRLAK